MDELNIHDGAASYQPQQNIHQSSELEDIDCSSEILLSKIEFEDDVLESPEINYNTASNKIKELSKTAEHLPFKKSKPYCGCGQYYSCTSSLYLHIRSKHRGQAPPGTIGGPKGIVKKPVPENHENTVKVQQNGNNNNIKVYPPNTSNKNIPPTPPPATNAIKPSLDNNASNSQYSGDLRSRKRQEQGPKACRICGKTYSCNSSLNLHLKRKHQMRKSWDGREISPRNQEEKIPRNFQCSICGLNYGSKSALGLHYNNKHSSKHQVDPNLPYDQNRSQKCGCGLVYQSRSALNMHVKKKHEGIYPEGTTQKPVVRAQSPGEQNKKDIGQYFDKLNNESDENQHSIYDSDYEDPRENNAESIQKKPIPNIKPQVDPEKPYKCGCGRNYSCSSSLNLHIKKNHNWVVPAGTIGGPRGMRNQQENRYERINHNKEKEVKEVKQVKQAVKTCPQCKRDVQNSSYFECKSCEENHVLCSKCFWLTNATNLQHEWQVIKRKQK